MTKYIIGALVGALLGYFIIYKILGCSTGACRITSNPYISTIYGLVIGLLLVGLFSPSKNKEALPDRAEYIKITAEEAKGIMEENPEAIIVDVRTKEEYDQGHIPGAILIPNETINKERPNTLPDLETEILVYCRSGNRSAQASRKLIELGYKKVYDFGGIIDWPYDTTN